MAIKVLILLFHYLSSEAFNVSVYIDHSELIMRSISNFELATVTLATWLYS